MAKKRKAGKREQKLVLISVGNAAKLIGYTRAAIYAAIEREQLRVWTRGGRFMVSRAAVRDYVRGIYPGAPKPVSEDDWEPYDVDD